MKYKVGDLVLIKEWGDLASEYEVDEDGDIRLDGLWFVDSMKKYWGKVFCIDSYEDGEFYRLGNVDYTWSDEMIYARVKPQDLGLFDADELEFLPDEYKKMLEEHDTFDDVTKPKHYADKEIEVIDYIRDTTKFLEVNGYEGYCVGNVIKYISRYTKKGNPEQDLKKALYYLNEVIKEMGGKQWKII